jgi:polysaccharide chain length determinant protein (PEP-CTERM system associated)
MYHLIIDQIKSSWRFRWLAVSAAWAVCIVGWLGISMQRDTYEASARVYVDTSSELRSVLGSQIIQPDIQDQLFFVREAILGSVRLEAVARSTGLADGLVGDDQIRLLIASLRRNIQIFNQDPPGTLPGNRPGGTTYVITFTHEDRAVAAKVVDTLLEQFVQFSLGNKATSSEKAGQFLREQIQVYEQRLTRSERELAKFNQQNYDRLPSMQGGYFQRLQDETRELDGGRQRLSLARSRLSQIEQQLRGESPHARVGEPDPNSIEARIYDTQQRLDQLLLRFTDNHPDVVATRASLDQMRAQQQRGDHEYSLYATV